MPGNYSYETVGSTRVIATTTGHEKVRMSVLVTATASGAKLPLICLIKRKDPIPGLKVPNNCIVVYCGKKDTFTTDILVENLIMRVINTHKITHNLPKILLIIDSAPCHTSVKFKNAMNDNNIVPCFIPPSFTSLLQMADTHWFRNMKASFRSSYNFWISDSNNHEFTELENQYAPPFNSILNWISMSWDDLHQIYIARSFKECGVKSELDDYHTHLHEFLEDNFDTPRENVYIEEASTDPDPDKCAFLT